MLEAGRCPNDHLTYPKHPLCPECGEVQKESVDLSEHTAEVLTWTVSYASPPGVREPNGLAIVSFNIDGYEVRALGQTLGEVEVGDRVRPVHVEELRDPESGIREETSQEWSGYRFEKI